MRWNPYREESEPCWIERARLRSSKLGVQQERELQSAHFQSLTAARGLHPAMNQSTFTYLSPAAALQVVFQRHWTTNSLSTLQNIHSFSYPPGLLPSQLYSALFTAPDFNKQQIIYTCPGRSLLPQNCLLCWNVYETLQEREPASWSKRLPPT